MPIESNFLISFAISIFVPTPSVLATILGFLLFCGISEFDLKPPILLDFLFCLVFFDIRKLNLMNLSASLMLTHQF